MEVLFLYFCFVFAAATSQLVPGSTHRHSGTASRCCEAEYTGTVHSRGSQSNTGYFEVSYATRH